MSDTAEASSASQPQRNRMVDSVSEKAQEVFKEDYGKAKVLVTDAAKSQSYLYPIKGIFYFISHRSLWQPMLSKVGAYLSLSLGVTASMFAFTYLPQLAVLVFVNGPLAPFTTALLILNESSTIVNIVSRNWLLQDALLDTFDGTLVSRNDTGIVSEGREIKSGNDPMQKLGKILKSPFDKFSPKALVRYFMYLPLNFIPVVGTVLFIIIQGRNRGKGVHGRYFQLKNWSASERSDWLQKHVGPYTAFGLAATLLEMIPVASMFFTFTNTVGAALWAADIEGKNASMTDGTAPSLRETAKKAD
ncbi:Fc.00g036900.m01.CDS01 [Cosmosporella sp. VM-42]